MNLPIPTAAIRLRRAKTVIAPVFVPKGQPDNSPAFQRRVIVTTGTSPTGTAERTAHGFQIANRFILKTPVVPPGLGLPADLSRH
jgi:hypothetical protein